MRLCFALVVLVAGCGRERQPDAGPLDTGPALDAGVDAFDAGLADGGPRDGGADARDGGTDAGRDIGADVRDASADTSADAGRDAPFDAGDVRVVFITRGPPFFDGNLGGLAGADATCNARASAAGLPGTYRAWLSAGGESPSTRFTRSSVPYVRVDGVVVATDWADLVDGSLLVPINVHEDGTAIDRGSVWTATEADGTPRGGAFNDCTDWTRAFPAETGIIGNCLYANDDWTALGAMDCEDRVFRLYCFQQ